MTVDDALRRLTAGLAEDERIARAAAELDAEGLSWCVRTVHDDGMYVFGEHQAAPSGRFGIEENAQTRHMELHDPKATLRRVEAIRKVLSRHDEAERDSALSERDAGFEAGLYAALEALADIYPEETDETGA